MIKQSQKQEGQFASFEDTAAHLPEPFVAEAPGRWHGNSTRPMGDQKEKFHRQAVRRLYLAIVNRAILDVLENGQESREAKQWLLSRDFDSFQAAVGLTGATLNPKTLSKVHLRPGPPSEVASRSRRYRQASAKTVV